MKKVTLMVLTIFISAFAYCQQKYYPIPESNAYWSVIEFNYWSGEYDDFLYTVEGDSMVNGQLYKKVYKLNDYPTIYDTITMLHCLMRQDSAQKKVWFIRTYLGDTNELLGYDFDVEIGDTVNLPAMDFSFDRDTRFLVENIEDRDIQYYGELEGIRKYYFLTNVSELGYTIEYIEGLVEYRSLFPNLDTIYYFDSFHQTYSWCMQHNGIYGWAKEGDNTPPDTYCGFLVLDVESIDISEEVTISPNPTNNYINIELLNSPNSNVTISIFNITGQLVKTEDVKSLSNTVFVDVSNLVSGLYTLHLKMNNTFVTKKIIKK